MSSRKEGGIEEGCWGAAHSWGVNIWLALIWGQGPCPAVLSRVKPRAWQVARTMAALENHVPPGWLS